MHNKGQTGRHFVASIVAAYVTKNRIPPADIPPLIAAVYRTLEIVTGSVTGEIKRTELSTGSRRLERPVSVERSMHPDFLISMENGKHYRSLKLHLTNLGMSPVQYREKWGLPLDYPMSAENYRKARSERAKVSGFGGKRQRRRPPR